MERLRKRTVKSVDVVEVPTQHKCGVCDKVFSRADTLSCHERLHSKKPIKCVVCSKTFSSKSKLKRHENIHDKAAASTHQCDLCERQFLRADALQYHKRTVHRSEQEAGCEKGQNDILVNARCDYCVGIGVAHHHLISVVRYSKPMTYHQCLFCLKITGNHSLHWKHHQVDNCGKNDSPKQKGFQCKRGCFRLFGSLKTLKQHESRPCYSLDSSELLMDVESIADKMEAWRKSFTATSSSS